MKKQGGGFVEEFTTQAPLFYTSGMIVTFFVLIFAIMLSIAALFRVEQLDNVRCWAATGEQFDDGYTSILLSTGFGVGGNGFIDFAVEYGLPASEGAILQVLLQGPLTLGVDPAPIPTALTICGGTVSCVDLETETCLRENLPAGCGRIANRARSLDVGDTPVEPGGRIVQLSTALEEEPQRFRILVSSTNTPNGLQQAYIGAVCKL